MELFNPSQTLESLLVLTTPSNISLPTLLPDFIFMMCTEPPCRQVLSLPATSHVLFVLCPLHSPVQGLSIHPASRRAPEYQLPSYSSDFLLDTSEPEPWPPTRVSWGCAHLEGGDCAFYSFVVISPLRSPWVLPAPTCQASSASLKSLLLLSNAPHIVPHTGVSTSLLSCPLPEIPFPFSTCGIPPQLCDPPWVTSAMLPCSSPSFPEPKCTGLCYSPKYQTSSETPRLPVSLRTLTSFKFEFLVCVSVDHPCTSKCLVPGGNCICSVHSQETLSLLQSPKVLSLFFFFLKAVVFVDLPKYRVPGKI